MAQYQATVDIWSLDEDQRVALQPGQWVSAGGAKGRWVGMTKGLVSVAAWHDKARSHPLGYNGYWQALRSYQKGTQVG